MTAKRLTIRFSDSEWEALDQAAGSHPMSAFAREKLLGPDACKRMSARRPKQDSRLLAQLLASLGQSDLPRSMRDLAHAAQTGTMPGAEEWQQDLRLACATIDSMRHDLTAALGIKPE